MYRTFLLFRALEKEYDVEIFGFAQKGKVWEPLAHEDLPIKAFPYGGWRVFFSSALSILGYTKCNLIIACKPRITSYGVALLEKLRRGTPVILDIDDDELAMTKPPSNVGFWTRLRFQLKNPDAYWSAILIGLCRRFSDDIFCVSRPFQLRYGGSLVRHGRDPDAFNLAHHDVKEIRGELNLGDRFVVVFLGTPRPHKGLETILESFSHTDIPKPILLAIGADTSTAYISKLIDDFPQSFIAMPSVSVAQAPRFLAIANAVVLPQQHSKEAFGQMPAKLTDAMLMGVPIIATRISDIPEYLEGRGILVEDPDSTSIGMALSWIHNNEHDAIQLGAKAREYALEHLTDSAILATISTSINEVFADRGQHSH